jgi:predicted lactoylglutathione lyase
MEKDKWIENILNSTNGITQVNPNNQLFSKIQAKINDQKTAENYTKWLVAASIVVLLSLNTTYLIQKSKTNKQSNDNITSLVDTVNNQLY